ncbi:unnamed protein product [Victoria cruziana]
MSGSSLRGVQVCGRRAGVPRGVLEAPIASNASLVDPGITCLWEGLQSTAHGLRMVNRLREVLAPLIVQMAKKIV